MMTVLRPRLPRLVAPPSAGLVLLGLLTLVLMWTLPLALSQQAPDLDSMEELVWSASLEWGYTKHPPLPTWLMVLATHWFGRAIWVPTLVGMLSSALGLWFVWKLGCAVTDRRRAMMAVLLVSVTTYFSLRASIYNHNSAQLASIAAACWLYHKALNGGRWRDWAWLGLVCGLAMLTKYSALIQFAAFALYALRAGWLRQRHTWLGIGLASAVFLVVLSPHLVWLIQHQLEPLQYADASLQAGGRWAAFKEMVRFVLDQVARLSPMLLVLGGWWLWHARRGDRDGHSAANDARFTPDDAAQAAPRYLRGFRPDDVQFLLWVGLAPLLSTLLVSTILGTRLEAAWATTFFVLFGFYALWWLRGEPAVQLRRIVVLVLAVQLVMALGYAVARGPLASWVGHPTRANYPGPELAALALQHWREAEPSRPLRVVVANTWLGGNIAVNVGENTRVYIDASDAQSPWFAPGTALHCGALLAFSERGRARPSAAVRALYEQAQIKGVDELQWAGPRGRTIDFHWAVLPADEQCLAAGG